MNNVLESLPNSTDYVKTNKKAAGIGTQKSKTTTFWLFTISEFVIVVLGILLVLQIDNWKESRKASKLEHEYLYEIKAELLGDLSDIELNINILGDIQNSLEIIIQFLGSNSEYVDSLDFHLSKLLYGTHFFHDKTSYESLKATDISIISDKELRKRITMHYAGHYNAILRIQDIHNDFVVNNIFPEYIKHIQIVKPMEVAKPLNVMELKRSNEMKSLLNFLNMYIDYHIFQYKRTKESIDQIFEMIEKEYL